MDERTYSVRAVSKLTGLSPDVLRAWERRYGAVEPLRTDGGTRRYREQDVERLRLLQAAVRAGHRIGEVADLETSELRQRSVVPEPTPVGALGDVMKALERLDASEAERLIAGQLAALGPSRFASQFALPLLEAIGEAWAQARLCMASEHLGSSLLRSLLGSALRPTAAHRDAPLVVFGTPPGERHEMGRLAAARTALGAGANPLYLGPDLPLAELVRAVEATSARALAVGLVVIGHDEARQAVDQLRQALPKEVELWIGGARVGDLEPTLGVESIESLERLEQRVEMLCVRS